MINGGAVKKTVSASQAKYQFSSLIAEVAIRGNRILIERRGKPAAAIVSVGDLDRLENGQPTTERPVGALALVGAWADMGDDAIDAFVRDIYASREQDQGRHVELEA